MTLAKGHSKQCLQITVQSSAQSNFSDNKNNVERNITFHALLFSQLIILLLTKRGLNGRADKTC
jgi:hypothetical protein